VVDDATRAKLVTIFGEAITSAAVEVDATYGPAIGKLGWKGLVELDALCSAKKKKDALALLHTQMTAEDLANEKASMIGPLLIKMADDNAEAWSLTTTILLGAIKAAMAIAVSLVGL
jgi:hypothetical protein